MILQIEFQHVIRTNEQNEIKPFEFKSIIRTSEGDQTDYWNIADPAPDFGCRQFVYVWFEHISDNAIKEIEAFTPSPFISFWNNGWTEYRNFIKLSVLPDSAVQELQLKEARQLSKQLDLKYQNWQKELAETQTAASPKIFPFQIYQYVSELVEVKSILEQSPKSSPTSEHAEADKLQRKTKDKKQNSVPIIKVVNARPKGGRRTKEEEAILYINICITFLYMVAHPNKDGGIKSPSSFADAVNGRIKRRGGNIIVNARMFDKGKLPGKLYRYLLRNKFGICFYGYKESDFNKDKDFADECIDKTKEYINRLDDKRKKKLLEEL